MIKELVKIANRLDAMDLKVEADTVDGMIRRIASSGDSGHRGFGSGNYGIYHMSPVGGGVYTVTWFDTLEEAQRELSSGYYHIDGGGYPYIVTRKEMKLEENVKPVRRRVGPPNLASLSEIERMNRHREEEMLKEKEIADRNRMLMNKELLYQDLE